jgi:hypothetical protein
MLSVPGESLPVSENVQSDSISNRSSASNALLDGTWLDSQVFTVVQQD